MCCIILLLQISLLDSAVNHLKANLKSAADLISLPTTVEELQKVKAEQNWIKREICLTVYYKDSVYAFRSDITECFFFLLFQSVATIGSTLTSVQHDVKTMQAALENQKKDDDLKKTMVNSNW